MTVAILFVIFAYALFKIDYNWTDYKSVNALLISCSGIFSAIVISVLLSGLSNLKSQRLKLKDRINILSEKLTAFRRLLYYVIHSDDFWNNAEFNRLTAKIRHEYPKINSRNTSEVERDKSFRTITKNEHFESHKMSLFLNLLTIVDVSRDEELSFIQPSSKYKYTAKKLEYYHECFNNIWYYLNHKSATGLNDTKNSISSLYRDNFTETYKKIEGNNVSWQDFNSQLLVSLGNKFYEETIPELHKAISEITSNIPITYIKMIITLIVILIFGTIIPLITSIIKVFTFYILLKICVITTLLALTYLILLIIEYTFKDTKIY